MDTKSPGKKSFRCSDAGPANCTWQTTGSSEQEIIPKIEQHGREAHNIQKMDDNMRDRVRKAIRDQAA